MNTHEHGYEYSYLVAGYPRCGNGVFTLVLETWNGDGILAGLTDHECRYLHTALTQHLTNIGEFPQKGHTS